MTTGPVLHTERLTLRPIALEDFPRWAGMMGDAEAAKYLGGAQAESTAWRGFMTMAGAWSLTGVSMFSVVDRQTGLWLGRIGPWQPHGWPGTEVGWGLHPDAQGKGYGVEAATAAMDYAFDVLGWTDIIHCIDPENVPSQKLAERIGSRNRGPTKMPAPFDHIAVDAWGQTRDEWKARPR
ncbi:GNAT family N-acetyltransferase [Brevundimonas lenta]|uniref:RimJ/RimL family protein N-acetyltransferase n=1 Tax=Brevundimonas lenta TaxID=424796 RepID=A0A7W6JFV3_9CAUL|nr:GNAT family N-acetyltransferase [Brevundimonas lenta]MBB4084352.1 RimJ/RimL family protein N-acetyltransferase [Brevundimonas lenta]